MAWGAPIWWADVALRELALFAAAGFLVGGLDELAIDLIWAARAGWRRLVVYSRFARADLASLAAPVAPGRIAVFIPAWDEAAVIGAMLATALARFGAGDYRLYVGCYPNDPGTREAVRAIAARDPRVRPVLCSRAGPTTKADCLNHLWAALLADEAADGVRAKAVVLHDAEDVVDAGELAVFDRLIERFDLVQLPVLPIVHPGVGWFARLVSGHYCDEFAEAHGKLVVVREALGAAIPSAGVGCAIARAALGELADAAGGRPFDAASLTEDYELGLTIAGQGRGGAFVRLPAGDAGEGLVAVRAFFPHELGAAVRQKARWMTGIALAGWDRLGWEGGIAERWMRLRDRRALLAALVLAAGYGALLIWGVQAALAWLGLVPPPDAGLPAWLVLVNVALACWRLAVRAGFVGAAYGWRAALCVPARTIVGNFIAMMAARRALFRYLGLLRGEVLHWDKTAHHFPVTDA